MQLISRLRADTSSSARVTVFTLTLEGEQAARQIAATLGNEKLSVLSGGLVAAVRLSGSSHFGEIVIIELKADISAADIQAIAEVRRFTNKIVALGPTIELQQFRQLLAAGVADYLPLPLASNEQINLIPSLISGASAQGKETRNARCIGVISCSGGIGATSLACNLATLSSETDKKRVALIDLDVHFGSAFIHFNEAPTEEFLEALMLPQRVDETFLTATMAHPLGGLYVYSTEKAEARSLTEPLKFREFLKTVRPHFDEIILDIPRHLLASTPEIADFIDEAVLLVSPGFSSLRNRLHVEEVIRSRNASTSVTNILSLAHPDAKLKESEISSSLGVTIHGRIPLGVDSLAKASVEGRPVVLVEPKSAISKAYSQVHARFSTKPVKRPSLLGRILGA